MEVSAAKSFPAGRSGRNPSAASRASLSVAGSRLGFRSKTAKDLATEALAEVLHSILQIEIDRPNVDPETVGNLAMRELVDMGRNENVAPAGRQFRQRLLEFLHFDARFRRRRRIRCFVGEIDDRLNLRRTQELLIASAPVTRNVERGLKQIIERAADFDCITDPVDTEEGLVQRLAGKVCGAQAAGQAPGQPFVVGRKGLSQRFAIRIGHLRCPIPLPFGAQRHSAPPTYLSTAGDNGVTVDGPEQASHQPDRAATLADRSCLAAVPACRSRPPPARAASAQPIADNLPG